MPTPVACLLNRPEITFSFVLNGANGSRLLLNSISWPTPLAHQWLGLIPLPMKSAANRLGGLGANSAATGSLLQTGTDSSQGKPIVTPAPRRNMRRERWWREVGIRLALG